MTVAAAAAAAAARAQLVKGNKVMIFIKGPPEQPQCGFSMQVVRILNFYGALEWSLFAQRGEVVRCVAIRYDYLRARAADAGVAFTACNILEHPAIRANIKHYVYVGAAAYGWRACAAA